MEQKAYFKDYNETLKQDRLLGIKCRTCGAATVPPKMACRQCSGTDVETIELEGDGQIRTFTTVFVASEGREDEVPYIVVMVELDAGPWVMGNLKGIDPTSRPIRVVIETIVQQEMTVDIRTNTS